MHQIKKILLFWMWLAVAGLISPMPALAQSSDHFQTRLTTTYSVDLSGTTRVEHAFEIRNLTPEYYINSYGLTLGSSDISNVKVVSNNQIIEPTVNQQEKSTEIIIDFPDQLVGKDKIRKFSITYLNSNIAQVSGQVLEAHIPAMRSEEEYSEHKVVLVTPAQFGEPTRISPENYQLTKDSSSVTLVYSDIHGQGVSAIFGTRQVFNLSIRYHLVNPGSQPGITQVSLPPDTAYQQVFYHQLDPQPQVIEVDEDNNWIATYYLAANETKEVNILVDILASIEPIQPWLNVKPTANHFNRQSFWESDHPQIKELAAEHNQPQQIYDFVVDTLSYTEEDLSQRFDRLGAVKALNNPQDATCQEFTDLFIAMARASGIPARRATGYAHSNDPELQPLSLETDVLHAWPEYYDQQTQQWVPIDPTWGSTMAGVDYFNQLDLKRVVFAYNGKSSRYPLAAGDYKLPDQETKDIQVEFKQEIPKLDFSLEADFSPRKIFGLISLPSWYQLTINNRSSQAWYHNKLEISAQDNNLTFEINPNQFDLLPWQKKRISVKVFNQQHWLPAQDTVNLKIISGPHTYEEEVAVSTIKPVQIEFEKFELNFEQLRTIKLETSHLYYGLGVFAFILAAAAGSLLVFRRKQ